MWTHLFHAPLAFEQKRSLVENILQHLDYRQPKEQLDEFQQEHGAILQAVENPLAERRSRTNYLFTCLGCVGTGVGKNSTSTDLLTAKYAKPNDLWFHLRGASVPMC